MVVWRVSELRQVKRPLLSEHLLGTRPCFRSWGGGTHFGGLDGAGGRDIVGREQRQGDVGQIPVDIGGN